VQKEMTVTLELSLRCLASLVGAICVMYWLWMWFRPTRIAYRVDITPETPAFSDETLEEIDIDYSAYHPDEDVCRMRGHL
jgi:hypothetical protein